jgi:hypothetical protein
MVCVSFLPALFLFLHGIRMAGSAKWPGIHPTITRQRLSPTIGPGKTMHHIQKRRITAANKNLMTSAGIATALVDPHSSVTACTILVEGGLKLVDLILRSFLDR